MRIVHVSPFAPERDGIADYTARLAGAMRARGHSCPVVTRHDLGAPPRALAERIASLDPDVVHVQYAVAAYGTRALRVARLMEALRDRGVRVVATLHEVTRDTALLGTAGRRLYRRIAAAADVVVVHTPPARDTLAELGVPGARVRVVPHPRPAAPPATTDAAALRRRHGLEGMRLLVSFGFIHVDKGLGDLVGALGILRRERPDLMDATRLVVAGDVRRRRGAFRAFEAQDRLHLSAVRRAIAAEGLSGHVVLTGYVPAGEVGPWLDAADALVLPYRRIEQSGVASLAATAGVPMVVTDVGTLAHDFGDRRFVAPPADPPALAEALARFLAADPTALRPPATSPQAEPAAVVAATLALYGTTPPAPVPEPAHA